VFRWLRKKHLRASLKLKSRNDYVFGVEVPDAKGRPRPASVRRFHDGDRAGGTRVEAGSPCTRSSAVVLDSQSTTLARRAAAP
jgi:hypothetical protein